MRCASVLLAVLLTACGQQPAENSPTPRPQIRCGSRRCAGNARSTGRPWARMPAAPPPKPSGGASSPAIPGRMNTTRWLNSRRFRRASIRPQMNCQRAPFRSLRPRIRHERRDHHRPFPRYVLALHRLGLRLIAGRSGISHRHAHRHRHDDRWPVLGHEPRHRPGRRRDRQAAAQGALCRRVRLHHRQLQLAGEHRVPLVRRLGNHRYRLGHHDGELSSAGPAGEDRHRRSRADSGTDRGHGWVPRGVREHRPYRGSVHRLAGGDPLLLRAGRTAFHHADRVQTDYARRLRLDPVCTLEQDLVPRGKGARQRGVVRHQGLGAGRHRRHWFRAVCRVPGTSRRTINRPRAGRDAGLARAAGAGHFRPRYRHRPGVRCATAWCGRDGWCCGRGCRHRRCHRSRRNGSGRRRHGWGTNGPGGRKAGRCRRACRDFGGRQCPIGVRAGSAAAGGGAKGAAAGLGNVAKTGAQAAGRSVTSGASAVGQKVADSFRAGWNGTEAGSDGAGRGQTADGTAGSQKQEQPAWAKRMHRRQQATHAATTAAHTLRGGDGGGSGQGPSLRDSDT